MGACGLAASGSGGAIGRRGVRGWTPDGPGAGGLAGSAARSRERDPHVRGFGTEAGDGGGGSGVTVHGFTVPGEVEGASVLAASMTDEQRAAMLEALLAHQARGKPRKEKASSPRSLTRPDV